MVFGRGWLDFVFVFLKFFINFLEILEGGGY